MSTKESDIRLREIPKKPKHFRDPIHGMIEVDPKARYIIGSPFFQRLRRIKQLASTYLVYHGAEHSRFGHSLGVYHLARRLTDYLGVDDSDVADSFCLASLLHDIGHFPLSHSFEFVARSFDRDLTHEKYTEKLIQHSEIADRLQKVSVEPKDVIAFLKGRFLKEPRFAFLNGLLNAELDIDRLDFLLRDSYYCGVTYGNYDLERLILSMKPYQDREVVITEKGIHSVEIYVLARFNMYLQVYVHHTRRAFDLMLKTLFPKESFGDLAYPKPKKEEIDLIMGFDDSWLMQKIEALSGRSRTSFRSCLANQFLQRDPIRRVCQCLAFTDVLGKRELPAYTTLSYFSDQFASGTSLDLPNIPREEVWGDKPIEDIPFENRYRPFSYRGVGQKGIIRVWANPKEEPMDIAEYPGSLASFLARNMVQLVRVYTTKKHRIMLRDHLKERFAKFKDILWFPTF